MGRYTNIKDLIKLGSNRVFYHITERSHIDRILAKGLEPNIGSRMNIKRDGSTPIIFMTCKECLQSWIKSLTSPKHPHHIQDPVVIKVDCTGLHLKIRDYYRAGIEISCEVCITPDRLEVMIL